MTKSNDMNKRREFLKKAGLAFLLPGSLKKAFGQGDDLPRVLLLGDSISIGYTPFVQEMLNGKALVLRPVHEDGKPENCQGTTNGVKNIDRWIGGGPWDVIHFNFGLHDLKHVDAVTGKNSEDKNDPYQADLKQYKKNMEEIVVKLVATGAKLIFANTTPYPDDVGSPLRDPGMSEKYNLKALKVMKRHHVILNDLHGFVLPRMAEIQQPRNVHFTEEGSRALAKEVAEAILNVLAKK